MAALTFTVEAHRHLPRTRGSTSRVPFGVWTGALDVTVVRVSDGTKRVMLREPLAWTDPDGTTVTIPAGFLSDGASLPPATWWLLGGKLALDWISAALVHDYACVHRPAWAATSARAHARFYDGLRADGMPAWRARAAYTAVSLFGPRWSAPSSHS